MLTPHNMPWLFRSADKPEPLGDCLACGSANPSANTLAIAHGGRYADV